jgi:hypothetical protein
MRATKTLLRASRGHHDLPRRAVMAYCAIHNGTFDDRVGCPYCSQDEDEDACTCDFDEVENCPAHYPIDDGSEDDDEDDDE